MIVPFDKVMFVTLCWVNQAEMKRDKEPAGPTYLGGSFDPNERIAGSTDTVGERMAEKGRPFDTWKARCRFALGYRRDRFYNGVEAVEMHRNYQSWLMGKSKKKKDKK